MSPPRKKRSFRAPLELDLSIEKAVAAEKGGKLSLLLQRIHMVKKRPVTVRRRLSTAYIVCTLSI